MYTFNDKIYPLSFFHYIPLSMASHGPAECEEPHLGRAAGIDGDDDVESQHLLQRGSNDRKQQRRRFFRVKL